ncbi:MAG: aspartyl-trna synthetase [Alphaproteobacteria bacterium]|nr:aspartyl-trna synthetase [Alphaproteobacteria bacterium]
MEEMPERGKLTGRKRGTTRLGIAAAGAALVLFALPLASGGQVQASADGAKTMPERRAGASTGLPVPRFVSLKSGKANVRRGPGTDFPIDWVYIKSGVPLEVIAESNNWRRIRDHEGDGGWIWHTMLGGERTAIVDAAGADGTPVALHAGPRGDAAVVAYAEMGYVARVRSCRAEWCQLDIRGLEGWIPQDRLWGIYPGESFE